MNTNTPDFIVDGRKAGDDIRAGSARMDKGEARAVVVLCAAIASEYEMAYTVERKKDERDTPVTFTLSTYTNNIVSENGKNDSKAISARKAALYADLFGLTAFTAAQDGVIARALVSAYYLAKADVVPTLNSKGQLSVPYELIMPEPKADASDNTKALYGAMKGKPLSLDGKKGTSLRELRNRAIAASPKVQRKARTAKDEGSSFTASLNMVLATITTINSSDESPVALTDELINKLTLLAAGIGALQNDESKSEVKKAA